MSGGYTAGRMLIVGRQLRQGGLHLLKRLGEPGAELSDGRALRVRGVQDPLAHPDRQDRGLHVILQAALLGQRESTEVVLHGLQGPTPGA